MLVPRVKNVTVRLLWQKEKEMKNALGQSGHHWSFLTKFAAVAALVLPRGAILASDLVVDQLAS